MEKENEYKYEAIFGGMELSPLLILPVLLATHGMEGLFICKRLYSYGLNKLRYKEFKSMVNYISTKANETNRMVDMFNQVVTTLDLAIYRLDENTYAKQKSIRLIRVGSDGREVRTNLMADNFSITMDLIEMSVSFEDVTVILGYGTKEGSEVKVYTPFDETSLATITTDVVFGDLSVNIDKGIHWKDNVKYDSGLEKDIKAFVDGVMMTRDKESK